MHSPKGFNQTNVQTPFKRPDFVNQNQNKFNQSFSNLQSPEDKTEKLETPSHKPESFAPMTPNYEFKKKKFV